MTHTKLQVSGTEQCAADATEKHGSLEASLEGAILSLLEQRGAGETICPSEAARIVAPQSWQELMDPTRRAAHRLVATGKIVVTQHGQTVDLSRAKGAIRFRLS